MRNNWSPSFKTGCRQAPCVAFVAVTPLQLHSQVSRDALLCRRPVVYAKAKGFGSSKPTKKKPEPSSKPTPTPGSPKRPSSPPDENFTPRGPTLQAEYEKRGLIDPTITPDSSTLPDIVAERMIRRIVTFAGGPLLLLFAFFAAYFTLKYKFDITVYPAVVGYSTLGAITLAAMGISYGIFSSSWDEDIEGSKLGFAETQMNLLRAKDALLGAREREIREEEFERIDELAREEEKEVESKNDENK